jgi:hypothetical protein
MRGVVMRHLASSVLAVLLLTAASGRGRADDPSERIKQLGSDREDVRAEAESALERRGREVLPLLRVATDSRDAVVRARALALIEKIEGAQMMRPTMVALDFNDRPVAEVVETIQRRSGLPIELFPRTALYGRRGAWPSTGTNRSPFWRPSTGSARRPGFI